MIPKHLFQNLPYGVCAFEAVQNRLLPCRKKAELPADAKSIIMVLFPYYLGEEYYRDLNISRYAVSTDYHFIVSAFLQDAALQLQRLYPANRFAPFCDNSPIPEVRAAAAAGLGVIGKNGLLIHPTFGSYCFIGEIVTDLPLPTHTGLLQGCIGCGKCEAACPNRALQSGTVLTEQCLSHISQKKQPLSAQEQALLRQSGCAWGCDICQTVCPMNRQIAPTPLKEFYERPIAKATRETELADRAYAWRGKKVIDRNLQLLAETE